MNKLSKDQIQKIFLSCLLMIGLIYCYFTFLITPLGTSVTKASERIEELNGNLAKARSQVLRSRSVEDQARAAQETVAQANDMIPDGAPIAWFPPRMNAFFNRHGLKNIGVHGGGLSAPVETGLKDFRNADWTLDVPQAGINQTGIALAGLENEEKLMEVTRLQISTQADAPEKQHVTINVLTLLK
jgi:hypothetical protein